jgi:hypothetical protein
MNRRKIRASTFLTTGNTQGFASLSLYAPMPKSIFLSYASFLYAVVSPKTGSSGAWGTTSAVKTDELIEGAMCAEILERRSDGVCKGEVVEGG